MKGYLFHNVYTDSGQPVKHFWSGCTYVDSIPEREPHFCTADSILKKVILYSSSGEASNLVTVVEYQRHQEKLPFDIVVPIYPEKGDMLLVQGAEVGDIWYGHARKVDYAHRTVDVYFFVESPRLPNTFIRESTGQAARNVVPGIHCLELQMVTGQALHSGKRLCNDSDTKIEKSFAAKQIH